MINNITRNYYMIIIISKNYYMIIIFTGIAYWIKNNVRGTSEHNYTCNFPISEANTLKKIQQNLSEKLQTS